MIKRRRSRETVFDTGIGLSEAQVRFYASLTAPGRKGDGSNAALDGVAGGVAGRGASREVGRVSRQGGGGEGTERDEEGDEGAKGKAGAESGNVKGTGWAGRNAEGSKDGSWDKGLDGENRTMFASILEVSLNKPIFNKAAVADSTILIMPLERKAIWK